MDDYSEFIKVELEKIKVDVGEILKEEVPDDTTRRLIVSFVMTKARNILTEELLRLHRPINKKPC